ncbi:adenylyltransferase/cytidyltransferase family protein [Listeria booriae]|uniref:Adenylyltransferase/cytidyltransferase family protein n=1 Tax=Listeria booriae TaxID=1552123 RepID=A0A7X0XIH7_9LIST|nr:adenylyltransferase/cytidyltransferase family protein [Listeria booriae]MBC1561624.1 adenylyltransferase/cytidyltransferase family protein [Listeria booriae]MBC1573965.1 adenylyltransferase/cytidyltransferase family protein [Listeria booriae]MBC1797079.1 adenylyltransferase/cytidyltransferase family protein [Listeria booriae]MBC1888709.1 adenylyltransferase/cytidyltransferase family protein [Listeria booriae]MBC2240560.1 adenylyltransferase/cytidyltransferase family protein [Listeria booria
MHKKIIGYTTGVFDMFHIGHLNLLKNAKQHCDYLIVGVTIDSLVAYKNKQAIIPFEERRAIVEHIDFVDYVVPQKTMHKMEAFHEHHFDIMFVGSDWKDTETWNRLEEEFADVGVEIKYLPYTAGTSSTVLRETLQKINA